jgi:membrane associated rhomboid family serine protease
LIYHAAVSERDWVDRVADLAAAVGMNRVQVRWKLERLRQRLASDRERATRRVDHIRYQHKTCPRCGRVNDRSDTHCSGCGTPLGARAFQILARIGLSAPALLSMSSLIGVALIAIYGRMLHAEGGLGGILAFQVDTLFRFGGHWPPAVWAGEWWRLGTAVFIHASLWHIGFNLVALSQVGPVIEELFGRSRMLLLFLVTGVLASIGSALWGLVGVSIGASGAIMGLCGVAAGWGQREGTTVGRNARNLMLKWALYTVVFGFFIGADNGAHVSGFIAGFVFGLVIRPQLLRRTTLPAVQVAETALGAGAALTLVVLVLLPVHSPLEASFAALPGADEWDDEAGDDLVQTQAYYDGMREICGLEANGDLERAQAAWQRRFGPTPGMDTKFLPQYCASLRTQQEQCRRLLGGEPADRIWPELAAGDAAGAAAAMREICSRLLVPDSR